jgi:hypothetical protein
METELKIKRLWFDDNKIFIQTEDEMTLWQSLLWYARLLHATDEQRNDYRFSYSGIHWNSVDEDISFESFLSGNTEPVGISRLFLTRPELNPSAIARRIGIEQGLLAAYIRGIKKPSSKDEKKILNAVREFGKELMEI